MPILQQKGAIYPQSGEAYSSEQQNPWEQAYQQNIQQTPPPQGNYFDGPMTVGNLQGRMQPWFQNQMLNVMKLMQRRRRLQQGPNSSTPPISGGLF